MARRPLIITTQPGWAFATLSELRAEGGEEGYVGFHHRDSTLACRNGLTVAPKSLRTPAEVFGEVISSSSRRGEDATRQLARLMRPGAVKRAVLDLLPEVQGTRPRRYSIACETLGRTTIRRQDLAQQIEQVFLAAFPGWRRSSDHAVRIFCKADPDFAFVGVQLHSNLGDDDPGRPGALRRHLACGLLQLAGVDADSLVLDPFMGTGAILDAAMRLYHASGAVGFEIDPAACDIAERRLAGTDVSVVRASYETMDIGLMDSRTRDCDEHSVWEPVRESKHEQTGSSPTRLLRGRHSNYYARLARTGRSLESRSWAATEERHCDGAAGGYSALWGMRTVYLLSPYP